MPSTHTVEAPVAKKRKIRLLWVVLGGLAILVLLASAALVWNHFQLEGQIQAELERIASRGEPASVNDLTAAHALPPGSVDHTAQWLAVLELCRSVSQNPAYTALPIVGTSEAPVPPPGTSWPDEPAVARLMGELEPALERLRRIRGVPGAVRYPLKFNEGFAMLLPHVQDLRQFSRMVELRARWQVRQGDAEGALESLLLMARAADTLEHEPIIVSQLVSMAIHGMMIQTALDLIPHANWSDAQLARLQEELLAGEGHLQCVATALPAERALGIQAFSQPEMFGEYAPLAFSWNRRADQLYYMQTYARLIAASEKRFAEASAEFAAIEAEVKNQSPLMKLRHPMTNNFLPVSSIFYQSAGRSEAKRRIAATLVACQRYRLAQGQWPAKLADLTPQYLQSVPLDPFDDQPLRFKTQDTEIVVYSVGQNLLDDGGVAIDASDGDVELGLKWSE